jgi:HD-GYP domain-containing protein (c-di-GMP phosphodiesterase class II)
MTKEYSMFIDYLAMLYQATIKRHLLAKDVLIKRKAEGLSTLPIYSNEEHWLQTLSSSEIAGLRELVSAYDHSTNGHAQRTATLAEAIAQQMHCTQEEIELSCLAALLHDIGKVAIPSPILFKPGPLNEEEWKIMRLHPEISRQMVLQAGGIFASVEHIVVAHHEHWDGGGYPSGLSGEDIPLLARILTVADSFDAMTTTRVYQQRLSMPDARRELLSGAGRQYDPLVVSAFVSLLDLSVVSKEVELNWLA